MPEEENSLRAQLRLAGEEVHHARLKLDQIEPIAIRADGKATENGRELERTNKKVDKIETEVKEMREANVAAFREIGLRQDEIQRDNLLIRDRIETHIESTTAFQGFVRDEFIEIKGFLKPIAEKRLFKRLFGEYATKIGKAFRWVAMAALILWSIIAAFIHGFKANDWTQFLALIGAFLGGGK